MDSHVDVPVCR